MKKLLALLFLLPYLNADYRVAFINYNGSSISIDTFIYNKSFKNLSDCEFNLKLASKEKFPQFQPFEEGYKIYFKSGDFLLPEERKYYFVNKNSNNDIKAMLVCLEF